MNKNLIAKNSIPLNFFEIIFEFWKTILAWVFFCALAGWAYLYFAPKEYQASAQINLAVIADSKDINHFSSILVEEPAKLILRMSVPTIYTPQTIQECRLAIPEVSGDVLAKKVKITIPKGVNSLVELKINANSPDYVEACFLAVFNLIKSLQENLTTQYFNKLKTLLNTQQELLTKASQTIARLEKLDSVYTVKYLSLSEEIRYRSDQVMILKTIIASHETRLPTLVAPIYIRSRPDATSMISMVLSGASLGFLMGFLFVFFRIWYRSNRN
jgi:uncharacterized protein involved in exopolysaccharide biosynthesis